MSFQIRIEWTDEQGNPRAETLRLDEEDRRYFNTVVREFRALSMMSKAES